MIVRILGEGQWRLDDAARSELNDLDDQIEAAVAAADQAALGAALRNMHDKVRASGQVVPDDEIADSDLILPEVDASLAEVRGLISGNDEGLIPS